LFLVDITGQLAARGSFHYEENEKEKNPEKAQAKALGSLVLMKLVPLFMVKEHQDSDQSM